MATVAASGRLCAWTGAILLTAQIAIARPLIPAGDAALRQDIQTLADVGIVRGPVSSWPLAWGPIVADLARVDATRPRAARVASALTRVRDRIRREAGAQELRYKAQASAAEEPMRMRGFASTPRESGEIGAGLSWSGSRFRADLNGQLVRSPSDHGKTRADGSMIGMVFGNYQIAASTMDRWWGPGWDGSLILSNNARPIPALTIDRNFTDAFETKWLAWLGPWDLSVMFGQMESERAVPDAQFFGFRFNLRPLPSLEIGLSRTAQWCGKGRPCNFDTFVDLIAGRDNHGDDGIGAANEPGNQLAGLDFRWAATAFSVPLALYGQFIGEDEAGGFPSRYLGQFGAEIGGQWGDSWSYRWFGEYADTSCGFYESDGNFNCAYNHGIYATGYRYRGRVIGHGSDNDARVFSSGFLSIDSDETRWQATVRYGELNRGGTPDGRNTLTPTKQELFSIDLTHGRSVRYGVVEIGAGVERIDDTVSGTSDNTKRAYIQWRSSR
jgi:hypothetical protein